MDGRVRRSHIIWAAASSDADLEYWTPKKTPPKKVAAARAAAHLHKGPFHDVRFFTPSDPIIFSEKDCRRRRRSVLFDVDRGRSLGYILPQIAPRARRCHDPASLHVHKSAVGVLLLLLLLLPFLLLGLVLVEPVDGGGGEGRGERDVPNLPRTVFLLLLLPSADICIG